MNHFVYLKRINKGDKNYWYCLNRNSNKQINYCEGSIQENIQTEQYFLSKNHSEGCLDLIKNKADLSNSLKEISNAPLDSHSIELDEKHMSKIKEIIFSILDSDPHMDSRKILENVIEWIRREKIEINIELSTASCDKLKLNT